MKIALDVTPSGKRLRGQIPWVSCQPFVENSKAVLIHRPRYVSTHQISDKYKPHISVGGWCGNVFSGTKKFTFLDAPPAGKLLCARCEEIAVKFGQPSSFELVGRHVHLGRCVAIQTCCEGVKP